MPRLNETRIVEPGAEALGGALGEDLAVRASLATVSSPHAQHSAALFIALEGEITITPDDGPEVRGPVVAVPSHLHHAARSPGPTLGLFYEPERQPRIGAYLCGQGRAFTPEPALGRRMREAGLAQRASLEIGEALAGLAREIATFVDAPARRLDRRVEAFLAGDRPAGISDSHLSALFVRDVGLPPRSYRLWRRLRVAVREMAHLDATGAAHAAGFADLAHFSRTCRRMLGYSPTTLTRGARPEDIFQRNISL